MKTTFRFLTESFRDKLGRASGRELTVFAFAAATLVAWFGDQFLGFPVKEYIFYGLLAVITAGLGLYTFERPKQANNPPYIPPVAPEISEPAPVFIQQNPQTSQPVQSTRPGGFPTPNRYPR